MRSYNVNLINIQIYISVLSRRRARCRHAAVVVVVLAAGKSQNLHLSEMRKRQKSVITVTIELNNSCNFVRRRLRDQTYVVVHQRGATHNVNCTAPPPPPPPPPPPLCDKKMYGLLLLKRIYDSNCKHEQQHQSASQNEECAQSTTIKAKNQNLYTCGVSFL